MGQIPMSDIMAGAHSTTLLNQYAVSVLKIMLISVSCYIILNPTVDRIVWKMCLLGFGVPNITSVDAVIPRKKGISCIYANKVYDNACCRLDRKLICNKEKSGVLILDNELNHKHEKGH